MNRSFFGTVMVKLVYSLKGLDGAKKNQTATQHQGIMRLDLCYIPVCRDNHFDNSPGYNLREKQQTRVKHQHNSKHNIMRERAVRHKYGSSLAKRR